MVFKTVFQKFKFSKSTETPYLKVGKFFVLKNCGDVGCQKPVKSIEKKNITICFHRFDIVSAENSLFCLFALCSFAVNSFAQNR